MHVAGPSSFLSFERKMVVVAEEEGEMKVTAAAVVVRGYDLKTDCRAVEEVERSCEVGPSGGELSLYTDLLGDPICRIRNSPAYLMLVAEMAVMNNGDDNERKSEIVGMIRGCIKTVTRGRNYTTSSDTIHDTKLAYILGLRVSPSHRRMGIGLKLVSGIEQWFKENGAEYSYMATENDNHASIKLFIQKSGYSKFRTPSILVQPVYAHRVRVSSRVKIVKLSPFAAETLYRRRFSTIEFFPNDIDSILHNNLNMGTYVAFQNGGRFGTESWHGSDEFLASEPESWAVLSIWNCKDVFKLEVRGASRLKFFLAKTSRLVDRVFPWLQLPSVPDIFSPFGIHFLYGLGGKGPQSIKLMKALCGYAHNLAKIHGCRVLATEVASQEPLKLGIPHWKRLSCVDLWCIKRLGEVDHSDGDDWTKSPPGLSVFVDPREI